MPTSTSRRRAVTGAVALIALAIGTIAAAAQRYGPDVIATRLRVTVTTTSDWTQVRLQPGEIVARRTQHVTGRGVVKPVKDVYKLEQDGRWSRAVVDVIYLESTGAPEITVRSQKGYHGETWVRIERTADGPHRSPACTTSATTPRIRTTTCP